MTNELTLRIYTSMGIIGALAILFFLGPFFISLALCVVVILTLIEFYTIINITTNKLLLSTGLFFSILLCLSGYLQNPTITMIVLICVIIFPLLLFLFLWGFFNTLISITDIALCIIGILYIPFLLHFALYLSVSEQIFVLLITVSSDVSAYFGGKFFGETAIWPKVSPKKTREGSIISLVTCTFLCLIYGSLFLHYSLWILLMISITLNILSQLGDFLESALKRIFQVKDSGTILPGHGGLLDRVDSLLLVVPTYFILQYIFLG
ncbi:MAG: phosphatidate cytidylyltransferase [Desulfovibrionaceae bacterium]